MIVKSCFLLTLLFNFVITEIQIGSRLKWEYEVIHFAHSNLEVARVMCQEPYRSELFLCKEESGEYYLRLFGVQTATAHEFQYVNLQIDGTNESWNYELAMICIEDETDHDNNYLYAEMSNKKGDTRLEMIDAMKKGKSLTIRIAKLGVEVSFTLSGSTAAFSKLGF